MYFYPPDCSAYKLGTTEVPEIDLRAYGYEDEGYNYDDAQYDIGISQEQERESDEYFESDYEMEYDLNYD